MRCCSNPFLYVGVGTVFASDRRVWVGSRRWSSGQTSFVWYRLSCKDGLCVSACESTQWQVRLEPFTFCIHAAARSLGRSPGTRLPISNPSPSLTDAACSTSMLACVFGNVHTWPTLSRQCFTELSSLMLDYPRRKTLAKTCGEPTSAAYSASRQAKEF